MHPVVSQSHTMKRSSPKIISKLSKLEFDNENIQYFIPSVDNEQIEPKIKIYDGCNNGSYFYRKIGFNSSIFED